MSLQLAADHLSSQGRFGDSTLVHMSPVEVAALQKLAEKHGMSLTINPETGLPEAFSLKKLLPMIAGMALNFFAPGVGTAIGNALGTSAAVGTGLAVGGFETLRTGDLGRGISAGLGAYGGASLGAGLDTLGSSAAQNASILANTGLGEEVAGEAIRNAASKGAQDYLQQGVMDRLGQGVSAAVQNPSAFTTAMGGTKGLLNTGLALASPIMADQAVQTTTKMPGSQGYLRPYVFDPYTQGLTALTPVSHENAYGPPPGGKSGGLAAALANGGAVSFADGGSSFVTGSQGAYGGFPTKEDYDRAVAQNAAEKAKERQALLDYQVTGKSGYGDFYNQAVKDPSLLAKFHNESDEDALLRLKYNVRDAEERLVRRAKDIASGQGFVTGPTTTTQPPTTVGPTTTTPTTTTPTTTTTNTQQTFNWQDTPIDRLPTIEQKKPEDAMSGESLSKFLALMGKGSTATKQWDKAPMRPYLPQPEGQYFIQRDGKVETTSPTATSTTTTIKPTTTTDLTNQAIMPVEPPAPGMEWYWSGSKWEQKPIFVNTAADGGLMAAYAGGGYTLGGYSDGGRLLRGPGDGVSDSIPATIADRRPARLADGEFVVPARIVSELGNGSTEAGARKLYAMMDRVQKARGKTTGKGRVAVNSRADKHLPA